MLKLFKIIPKKINHNNSSLSLINDSQIINNKKEKEREKKIN